MSSTPGSSAAPTSAARAARQVAAPATPPLPDSRLDGEDGEADDGKGQAAAVAATEVAEVSQPGRMEGASPSLALAVPSIPAAAGVVSTTSSVGPAGIRIEVARFGDSVEQEETHAAGSTASAYVDLLLAALGAGDFETSEVQHWRERIRSANTQKPKPPWHVRAILERNDRRSQVIGDWGATVVERAET